MKNFFKYTDKAQDLFDISGDFGRIEGELTTDANGFYAAESAVKAYSKTLKHKSGVISRIDTVTNDSDKDINLNKLIDKGVIKIVSIYPGKSNEEWINEAKNYPKNWVVGACDDIYDLFDLRVTPTIYQLDDRHLIMAKNLSVDGILNVVGSINF